MTDQPIQSKPERHELPPHIEETVQSVALLHAAHHRNASTAERAVDRVTSLVSQPSFLGFLGLGVVAWIAVNLLLGWAGQRAFDIPPFPWLEDILTLLALAIAALIVTTQRRADKLADLREQMTLELILLTEQKVAKIIELIEELRRDSPEVRDRVDREAHVMAVRTDANAVLDAIEETDKEMKGVATPSATN